VGGGDAGDDVVGSLDTEALAPLVGNNAALSLAPGHRTEPAGPREGPTAGFGLIIRQRDHSADHDQAERARLFTNLLDNLDTTT
jgi:hypothetical protein